MTRELILDAASQIFSAKGYHATSMQDIANAVNLKKSSLYHHFESKQEILLNLLERAISPLLSEMENVVNNNSNFEEMARNAISSYVTQLTSDIDLASVLLIEYRSLNNGLVRAHINKRDRYEAMWQKVLRKGVVEGIIVETDIEITSKLILGMMNWLVIWYSPNGKLSPTELCDYIYNLAFNGLIKR